MFKLLKLARRRLRSPDDYRELQLYIATKTLGELEQRGIDVGRNDVLELGAGKGGYSAVLNGASRTFLATDIERVPFFTDQGIPFCQFDVMKPFPLEPHTFDLIYCSSLIEHVPDPARLLQECRRVLRLDGRLYLSFPPFYSLLLVGGHGFKPFHLLGKRVALRVHNRRTGQNLVSYAEVGGNLPLYPRTIDQVAEWIRQSGFEITHTYTRMSRLNTARLPWRLKDLTTWHVCFLARPHHERDG